MTFETMTRRSALLATVAAVLSSSGCTPQDVEAMSDAFASLVSDKNLIEQMATDIKNNIQGSKSYSISESNYNDARAAYDMYLKGVSLAVANNQPHMDLTMVVEPVQAKSQRFLSQGVRSLDPTRSSSASVNPPANLHAVLCRLTKKQRLKAVNVLTRELRWAAWSDLGPKR